MIIYYKATFMQNSNKFSTDVISLEKVSTDRFVIPTYQRPYVWQEEQINKLLKDCAVAFISNPEKPYFIGTVLTSKRSTYHELIDGQQRFTTLWLIAVVFHKLGINSLLRNYLKAGDKLRLGFEIRTEVEQYFSLLEANPGDAIKKYSDQELENSLYLKDISKAVSTIEGKLLSLDKDLKQKIELSEFGDYIFSKVLMINNVTPNNINLNKLFATINNSGVQLEQTDIVKANLLKLITTDKLLYSKIWETCENMNDYFERNIRKTFTETDWNSITSETFSKFDPMIFKFVDTNENVDSKNQKTFTIRNIIDNFKETVNQQQTSTTPEKSNEIYCRSIINFGQLLLHTYRIFLKKKGEADFDGVFHVNRLIEIFKELENRSEEDVKLFFEILWKVRYVFDSNVIKWIVDLDTKNEHLELTNVTENISNKTKQFQRNVIVRNNSVMLQSVLYFTGDYLRQYWLTPFLYRLLDTDVDSIIILEPIDNTMSLSQLKDKEISYKLCNDKYDDLEPINLEAELNDPKGTGFKHYWFQKLEYILWKDWDKNDNKIKDFRITSKNSVEHVFPQHHEFKEELEIDILNSFGNLGLLSVSQNSSYSHQDVKKKKVDFDKKNVYDSLKLAHIYRDNEIDNWSEKQVIDHQNEMIELCKKHYKIGQIIQQSLENV